MTGSPELLEALQAALETVADPCMVAAGTDLSIVELGLVDEVQIENGVVDITVTLTEPGCQFTHHIVADITDRAGSVAGVREVRVHPRWAPLWTESRLTPAARARLSSARRRMRSAATDAVSD